MLDTKDGLDRSLTKKVGFDDINLFSLEICGPSSCF